MKFTTSILLAFSILFLVGCKSDAKTDKIEPKSEKTDANGIKAKKESSEPMKFEVRHNENKNKTRSTINEINENEAQNGALEQKMKAGSKVGTKMAERKGKKARPAVLDVNFPSTMQLVSKESIEKALNIESGRLQKKEQSHNRQSGISKSLWSWNESNGESNKLNVIVVRNPSPDTYTDWSSATFDRYINTGLKTNDGSTLEYKEIKKNGYRYAFNKDFNMLKWFQGENYSISLSGFGEKFNEKNMIKLAEDINEKIKTH